MKYVCELCGMIYDEDLGDTKHGIPAGTAFADLAQHYACPACGSEKEAFTKLDRQVKAAVKETDHAFWQNAKYSDGHQESDR